MNSITQTVISNVGITPTSHSQNKSLFQQLHHVQTAAISQRNYPSHQTQNFTHSSIASAHKQHRRSKNNVRSSHHVAQVSQKELLCYQKPYSQLILTSNLDQGKSSVSSLRLSKVHLSNQPSSLYGRMRVAPWHVLARANPRRHAQTILNPGVLIGLQTKRARRHSNVFHAGQSHKQY